MKYAIFYLIIINLVGFITMYVDKRKARHKKWRIPERRIFLIAALFGSPGVFIGMYVFRHKTQHMKFVLGVPAIAFVQIFIVLKILKISF